MTSHIFGKIEANPISLPCINAFAIEFIQRNDNNKYHAGSISKYSVVNGIDIQVNKITKNECKISVTCLFYQINTIGE